MEPRPIWSLTLPRAATPKICPHSYCLPDGAWGQQLRDFTWVSPPHLLVSCLVPSAPVLLPFLLVTVTFRGAERALPQPLGRALRKEVLRKAHRAPGQPLQGAKYLLFLAVLPDQDAASYPSQKWSWWWWQRGRQRRGIIHDFTHVLEIHDGSNTIRNPLWIKRETMAIVYIFLVSIPAHIHWFSDSNCSSTENWSWNRARSFLWPQLLVHQFSSQEFYTQNIRWEISSFLFTLEVGLGLPTGTSGDVPHNMKNLILGPTHPSSWYLFI